MSFQSAEESSATTPHRVSVVDVEEDPAPVQIPGVHAFLTHDRFIELCDAVAHDHHTHPDHPWVKPEIIAAVMSVDEEAELVGAEQLGHEFTTLWRVPTSDGQHQWAGLCLSAGMARRFRVPGLIEPVCH
jgi:hypothetical protein